MCVCEWGCCLWKLSGECMASFSPLFCPLSVWHGRHAEQEWHKNRSAGNQWHSGWPEPHSTPSIGSKSICTPHSPLRLPAISGREWNGEVRRKLHPSMLGPLFVTSKVTNRWPPSVHISVPTLCWKIWDGSVLIGARIASTYTVKNKNKNSLRFFPMLYFRIFYLYSEMI